MASGASDPVPSLFLNAWGRLGRIVRCGIGSWGAVSESGRLRQGTGGPSGRPGRRPPHAQVLMLTVLYGKWLSRSNAIRLRKLSGEFLSAVEQCRREKQRDRAWAHRPPPSAD